MPDDTSCPEDNFKDVFKYYKRKQPPPDLSQVLDVDSMQESDCSLQLSKMTESEEAVAEEVGLVPQSSWRVYYLQQHPGLLVIRNPFTRQGQLRWMERCLKEYPCASNPSNLASHSIKLSDQTWWELCQTHEGKKSGLERKLRWVTLGYHHNWDTKEYSESMHGEMPRGLVELCGVVGRALGFMDFTAQAAILNYYHLDSTLAPHTDHSEPCLTAPLFSFSFGQSAVFLIGGRSKETPPTAIYLHSGDILVMSGSSRLSYHAVPRVVQVTHQPWGGENREQDEKHKIEDEFSDEVNKGNTGGENREQDKKHKIEDEFSDEVNKGNTTCQNQAESKEQEGMNKTKDKFTDEANKCNKNRTIKTLEDKNNERTDSSSCSSFNPPRYSTRCDNKEVIKRSELDEEILEYIKTNRINMNVRQVLEPSVDRLPR